MAETKVWHYTTAPEEYDYSHTSTVRVIGIMSGKTVRYVVTQEVGASPDRIQYLAEYQQGRYMSGMNLAVSTHDWLRGRYATLLDKGSVDGVEEAQPTETHTVQDRPERR